MNWGDETGDFLNEAFTRLRLGSEYIEAVLFFTEHHNLNTLPLLLQQLTVLVAPISQHISATDGGQQRRERHVFQLWRSGAARVAEWMISVTTHRERQPPKSVAQLQIENSVARALALRQCALLGAKERLQQYRPFQFDGVPRFHTATQRYNVMCDVATRAVSHQIDRGKVRIGLEPRLVFEVSSVSRM